MRIEAHPDGIPEHRGKGVEVGPPERPEAKPGRLQGRDGQAAVGAGSHSTASGPRLVERTPGDRRQAPDPDERPALKVVVDVLRVLRAERGDRRRPLRGRRPIRLDEVGAAVDPEPGQPAPVLGPAVDEERDLGPGEEVADAGEPVRIRFPLRLLVERE